MATTDMDDMKNETSQEDASGRGRITHTTDKVRQSASEAYGAARERSAALYGTARERATSAYESTRQGASQARERTAEGIDANPVAALIGGLALGALVAGLLPRTRRENEVLGTLGGRLNDTAREAALAARDAGREKLDEFGLNRDGLSEKISELASNASAALRRSADSGNGRGGKGN